MVNYLDCGIMPLELTYQKNRKLRTYARFYIWDDPLLFRRGAYQIIKGCVPEAEQAIILDKCHTSPYGGRIVEIEQPRKFSNQDSIGQHYSETVLNR